MPFITDNIESEGYLTATTITGTSIVVTGSTSGQEYSLFRFSADNQAGGYLSYKSRGTNSAPSSILSGDTFAVFGGRGYAGTAFTSTSKANLSFIASENWSSTNQGNYISFNTTPSGSTTRGESMKLDNNLLTLAGNMLIGTGQSGGTITASKELVLQQTGDTFGPSILRLRNRNGENGAIYETTDPSITLVDFIFKTSVNQRNIRYEARSGSTFYSTPEFQFGVAAGPSLVVGDNGIFVRGSAGTVSTSVSATTYYNLPSGFTGTYASYSSTPADPAGTTNTTGVMMGLGGAAKITPTATGKVMFMISGDMTNPTDDSACNVQMRTGTGTAPANGAALTGTTRGGLIKYEINNTSLGGTAEARVPFTCSMLVTGLTLNTAVWIDLALQRTNNSGTCLVRDISISAYELP